MAEPGHRVVGLNAVRTALKHGAERVSALWVDVARHDRRLQELIDAARSQGIALHRVDREQLDRLAGGANHQGAVAAVAAPAAQDEAGLHALLEALDHPPFVLVLDGVQDPHNLGACLRSADAAGVDAVVAPRDRSVGLTPVACKVASGAAESVPFFQVTNLARTLEALRDEHRLWVVGTAGDADRPIYDADLRGRLALVMGGEEKGLRRLTREHCDLLVRLPMAGTVESLNVSVAAGVALFEAVRQRRSRVPC
ncbi:MAG: 23S rRNA (guanosine(2251)-2'-O)-methyltransferase RlmB [Gammaproteobacteria bacterium]|jgi:23S rRNA (guanosine2251-2'-O)-methyltransferase|nr:23S rRNA (guanosine(2251)-2'-O)-methyltransferase RlmB [Gammaproteobacteria bacterium]